MLETAHGKRALDELLQTLVELARSPDRILAEDLGIIPPEVVTLRQRHGLPGMAVLQFGFHGDGSTNPYHPENIQDDQVVYTGTHDNDTTMGWWNTLDSEANSESTLNCTKARTPLVD